MFLTKKRKRIIVIILDSLILPLCIAFKLLSQYMLDNNSVECSWAAMGISCGSCGGTRCVNSILSFKFVEAFSYNQLVFLAIVYLGVSLILLNLYFLWDVGFAKKALKLMYNLVTLIAAIVIYALFIVFRNIPMIIEIFKRMLESIQEIKKMVL